MLGGFCSLHRDSWDVLSYDISHWRINNPVIQQDEEKQIELIPDNSKESSSRQAAFYKECCWNAPYFYSSFVLYFWILVSDPKFYCTANVHKNPYSDLYFIIPFHSQHTAVHSKAGTWGLVEGEKRTIFNKLHSFSNKLPHIFKLTCSLFLVFFFNFFSFVKKVILVTNSLDCRFLLRFIQAMSKEITSR